MMHPQSNAIIDVKTGKVLKYSELLKGKRVAMPSGYSMHPQAGTLLSYDGTELDLVELLLTRGSFSGTETQGSLWEQVEGEAGVRLKGTNGTATGDKAISVGDDKKASDGTLYKSEASGDHAVAFGYGNKCSGRTTLAQGLYNIVSKNDSVAFGQRNVVDGTQSFASGQKNQVTALCGTAIGYQNQVTNKNGVAMGWSNIASGDSAIAMGDACTSSGVSSVAMGYKTHASGNGSATFGNQTIATNKYETSFGMFNDSITSTDTTQQTIFSVGNGSSTTARKNAFEVKANGDIYIEGLEGTLQDALALINQQLSLLGIKE